MIYSKCLGISGWKSSQRGWTKDQELDGKRSGSGDEALLHLDQAFARVVAASRTHSPSTLSFHSAIRGEGIIDDVGNDDINTSNDNELSRTDSPEGLNQLVTTSRRTSRTCKGVHEMKKIERVQKNLQNLKERKIQNHLEQALELQT